MRTAADYQRLALRLVPPGRIWQLARDGLSELAAIFLATGDESARVDATILQLIDELDPRTCHDVTETGGGMLRQWEALYQLDRTGLTPAQRRAQLFARVTASGGGSRPAFLVAEADALGFTIELVQTRSFRCGDTCTTTWDLPVGAVGMGTNWNWCFFVHAAAALTSDQRAALETLIKRITHARSVPLFVYDL